MAQFDPDVLDLIYERGFKPDSGYQALTPCESHRENFSLNFLSEQVAHGAPPMLLNLGLYAHWIQGNYNGVYTIWMSADSSGDESYPQNAKGIKATVGNHTVDGHLEGTVYVQFIDEDGNVLTGGETYIDSATMSGERVPRLARNCYLTLVYRTDLSTPMLVFGVKYFCFGIDSLQQFQLMSDHAVCLGTQSTYRPNEPFYQWYDNLKNDPWYDVESQVPGTEPAGGGGAFTRASDIIDYPVLPVLDICDTGFASLWKLSTAEVQTLSDWLWNGDFLDNIKKNWNDPFGNIIAFFVTPLNDELHTATDTLTIGNAASSISCAKLTDSIYEKDFGEVSIKELYKNFADYNTQMSIYLPYIGKRSLNPNDYMDGIIGLRYQIDVFTGQCIAHLRARRHGKMHIVDSYNGNINAQYPISGANFLQAYMGQINGLATAVSGATSGNPMQAVTSGLNGAMQAISAKPNYEKSGTLAGCSGRYGVKVPYIFFDTPQYKQPKNYRELNGYVSNIYAKLSSCSDYVRVKYMDLSGAAIPETCKERILSKLKAGIHIH